MIGFCHVHSKQILLEFVFLYGSVCMELPSEGEHVSIGFCEDLQFIFSSATLDPTDSRVNMDLYGIVIRT